MSSGHFRFVSMMFPPAPTPPAKIFVLVRCRLYAFVFASYPLDFEVSKSTQNSCRPRTISTVGNTDAEGWTTHLKGFASGTSSYFAASYARLSHHSASLMSSTELSSKEYQATSG